jgi:hypothetical protein
MPTPTATPRPARGDHDGCAVSAPAAASPWPTAGMLAAVLLLWRCRRAWWCRRRWRHAALHPSSVQGERAASSPAPLTPSASGVGRNRPRPLRRGDLGATADHATAASQRAMVASCSGGSGSA